MLLAFAQIQGPKLGLPQGVLRLGSHEACPLRHVVFLLNSDSLPYRAIRGRDSARNLHPRVFRHTTVSFLRILGQGGEGIHCVTTHTVPEGEALCLGEGPNFHVGLRHDSARVSVQIQISRQTGGIFLGGRPLDLLDAFREAVALVSLHYVAHLT